MVVLDFRASRIISQSGKSQVNGEKKVEKTQKMPQTEVEQLLKEEGDVDMEENEDGLQ